ncbi:MAG: DUF4118 domain-containing protein [Xanthobacteraceae bacterium]
MIAVSDLVSEWFPASARTDTCKLELYSAYFGAEQGRTSAARDMHSRGLAVVRAWFKDYFGEQFHVSPGSVEAYLAATVLVVIASLVRWGLGFLGETLLPFTTFYPVVLFATYFGGSRVGIFTSIAGGVVGWWAFLLPHVGFFPIKIAGELELLTYAVACALIIWGADSYRRLAKRLREEERLRVLAVEELAHRFKKQNSFDPVHHKLPTP